jgi:predicted RND superfamily exporter protein
MHAATDSLGTQPVVTRLDDFDTRSGSWAERLLFNHRPWVMLLCLLATLWLGQQAFKLTLNASFEKTIPTSHPYIANYLAHQADLGGQGNALRIVVEARKGTIYDKHYLEVLQKISDEIYLMPGVDRPFMKSLWTANTRWVAVTEDGLDGNTVMGDSYDGSAAALAEVRANVERSGEIGQIVAGDARSSIVFVPLLDVNPKTGQALDYGELGRQVEALRAKYDSDAIALHVTGFAKVMGDLIEGLRQVLVFFGVALVICAGVLWAYTRCMRSTVLVVACSLIAVVWQFGLLALLGYALDPYSVLVPFLVFAIGMSHGAQKMNGIMQDVGRGTHRVVAARYTFRRLFVAGLTALLCDAVGFAVLALIKIQAIQDLALVASIGVAVLIFTNLVLLPILLSYIGVSPAAAKRSLRDELAPPAQSRPAERGPAWSAPQGGKGVSDVESPTSPGGPAWERPGARPGDASTYWMWRLLDRFTQRGPALVALGVSAVLAVAGYAVSTRLHVGDLDPGAPELRADSRYNRDNDYVTQHYAASSDILVVMVATPEDQCTRYGTLAKVDQLAWQLEQLPGVESTNSMAALSKLAMVGYNEGQLKWYELIPNDSALGGVQTRAPRELFNQGCSFLSLYVYLKDHKAETLGTVVATVEDFIARNSTKDERFMLAAGSAGIAAATNIVVKQAMNQMLWWVYGAVVLLCWVTFRSWRAVVVAVLPLVLTSILCEALMVGLGMGVKVATLPVIALGVGIGVDYALYVLSVMLARLRAGESLSAAYLHALQFTGRVVMLTGVTLALAVGTWALSPIKFQADMGILLAFMFVWNMVGALVLLPALAHWLLKPARVADLPRPQPHGPDTAAAQPASL